MKTKNNSFTILICLALVLTGISAHGQSIRPAGVNIGLVEENIFFSSLRTLVPNQDWDNIFPESNIQPYFQLNMPYAAMQDYNLEKLQLFRKGNKLHRAVLEGKGRMVCEDLLEECFNLFGELQYPSSTSKSDLIFEWTVNENFAGQQVVYKLEDKKHCKITMQVNY